MVKAVTLSKNGKEVVALISVLLRKTWYPTPEIICTPKQWRIMRRQIGITQDTLAQILGVSKRAVENWECDEGKTNHRKIPLAMYLILKELHDRIFE